MTGNETRYVRTLQNNVSKVHCHKLVCLLTTDLLTYLLHYNLLSQRAHVCFPEFKLLGFTVSSHFISSNRSTLIPLMFKFVIWE